jgi:hypothetical protein
VEFKRLAEEYGVAEKMVADDLYSLRTLYAAMSGIAEEDIPEAIRDS